VNAVGENSPTGPLEILGEREQEILLGLARRSLVEYFQQTVPGVPALDDPILDQQRGCFVTLMRNGALRGCVGNVFPRLPLCQAVVESARSAAFCDSRFPPLERHELFEILIEISVLSAAVRLRSGTAEEILAQIRPHVDGVLLQVSGRMSTFLPQVWEKLPVPTDFMNCLAKKSGLAPEAWCDSSAVISVYQAQSFAERGD
jgi:hypothetical protein